MKHFQISPKVLLAIVGQKEEYPGSSVIRSWNLQEDVVIVQARLNEEGQGSIYITTTNPTATGGSLTIDLTRVKDAFPKLSARGNWRIEQHFASVTGVDIPWTLVSAAALAGRIAMALEA